MATTKRELTLTEQAHQLAVLEYQLHPEMLLDRSRPQPFTHDLEGFLKEMVKVCDRDAWQRNGR